MTINDPGDDDAKRQLLATLCRHIVGVVWTDENWGDRRARTGQRDPETLAFSAFVISVRGVWFLVTAGHVARQLRQRLSEGRRVIAARLMDGFSGQGSSPPVPFPLGETPQWSLYQDGLDYALFPLRPGYARPLAAGGVVPLSEEQWAEPPEAADRYFLLGFPSEVMKTSLAEDGRRGDVSVMLGTPLLPIQPLKDPPEELAHQPHRFFASVPMLAHPEREGVVVGSIEGMSGGPIFAVEFTGATAPRYWVVAVQSTWLKNSRILAACWMKPLADAIAKSMADHVADPGEHGVEPLR